MRQFEKTIAAIILAPCLVGCMTYPRLPSESSTTATQLMRDFGLDEGHTVIGPDMIVGNTLKSDIKIFITDSTVEKRYFGTAGNVFFQDEGMVAYGIIRLPTGSDFSNGDMSPYRYSQGLFYIDTGYCREPDRILITREKSESALTCWVSKCTKAVIVGWEKWNCSIESGNTLRVSNN